METFVREALARAAFERSEASGEGRARDFLEVRQVLRSAMRGRGLGDGKLIGVGQVEDLEKLAPQLLLDF